MIRAVRNFLDRYPWAPLAVSSFIFLSCYTYQAIQITTQLPLWEDEVLSVWAAQFPTPAKINWALAHGLQASPPVFSVMLHYLGALAGWSNWLMRLPAVAAELVNSLLVFLLFKRYMGAAAAAFAACLTLEGLSYFGVQARPYSLMVLCFTLALLCWDALNRKRSLPLTIGFCVALIAAIAFHFYSVFYIPSFALMEFLRARRTKEWRFGVWAAMFIAGLSLLAWSSVYFPWRHMVAQEVASSHTYVRKPTLPSLALSYLYLIIGVGKLDHGSVGPMSTNIVILALTLLLVGMGLAIEKASKPEQADTANETHSTDTGSNFDLMLIGLLSVPLIVFLCSLAGPKTYNIRYVLPAVAGANALVASSMRGFVVFNRLVPLLLIMAACLTIAIGVPAFEIVEHTATYQAMPGNYPIVVAEGSQFIQLTYSSPQQFRSRLVYLRLPDSVPVADATNSHTVERCARLIPDMPVIDASAFLAHNARYYVLDDQRTDDTPARYLLQSGQISPWKQFGKTILYRSNGWQ